MPRLYLKNTRALVDGDFQTTNILVENGKISDISKHIRSMENDTVYDCRGHYLLPGGIDIHTHIDDKIGPYDLADSYASASKIALLNGITTLYTFITQGKNESLDESIQKALHKAEGQSFCDYGYHVTPTRFDEKGMAELFKWVNSGYHSIKLYTTYKEAGIYSSYDHIRKLAKELKKQKVKTKILVHCEDESLLENYKEKQDASSSAYTHALQRPEDVEIEAIRRIIDIAEETGIHFHIVHVSTAKGLELISEGKAKAKLSCETGPQYLLLNDEKLKENKGYIYLCTPPLRNPKTMGRLSEYAIDGKIDIFATDHCAFTKADKTQHKNDSHKVPKGLPGIGSLLPGIAALLSDFSEKNLKFLAKHLSENPAKLMGVFPQKGSISIGADADLILLTRAEKGKDFKSSLCDTPEVYTGFQHHLDFKLIMSKGQIMIENNNFIFDKEPKGCNLCRK